MVKGRALLSLNVTDCKDESEEDLEIMVKSCYLLLQVEKLKPVMVGLKLEFAKMQIPGAHGDDNLGVWGAFYQAY